MKKYTVFIAVSLFLLTTLSVQALTKPSPDADMDSLSYVFYLYYDNGQLYTDRDFEIKYDVLNEKFSPMASTSGSYKGEIITFKSVIAKTFEFDPKQINPTLNKGKLQVKAPYVPDAEQVKFYNVQGDPILNVFVKSGSLCNDDGVCTSAEGENLKTCFNDCKQVRTTPINIPPPVLDEGPDLNTMLIYAVGGLGVLFGAWFGWKWWKKKRGESFLPPAPPPSTGEPTPPSALFPPPPPLQ